MVDVRGETQNVLKIILCLKLGRMHTFYSWYVETLQLEDQIVLQGKRLSEVKYWKLTVSTLAQDANER